MYPQQPFKARNKKENDRKHTKYDIKLEIKYQENVRSEKYPLSLSVTKIQLFASSV